MKNANAAKIFFIVIEVDNEKNPMCSGKQDSKNFTELQVGEVFRIKKRDQKSKQQVSFVCGTFIATLKSGKPLVALLWRRKSDENVMYRRTNSSW